MTSDKSPKRGPKTKFDLRLGHLILFRDIAQTICDKGPDSLVDVHKSLTIDGYKITYSVIPKCIGAIEKAWPHLAPPFISRDKDQKPSLVKPNGAKVLKEICDMIGQIRSIDATPLMHTEQFELATHTTFELCLIPQLFGTLLKEVHPTGAAKLQLCVKEIRTTDEALHILKYGHARLLLEAHPKGYSAPGITIHDLDFPLDWVAMIPKNDPQFSKLLGEEVKVITPPHLRTLPVCHINDPAISFALRGNGPRCELPSNVGIASFVEKSGGWLGIIYDWRRPVQGVAQQFVFKKVKLNFPFLRLAVYERHQESRNLMTDRILASILDHFGFDEKGKRTKTAKEEHLLRRSKY